jgi:hypothetical protein
MMSHSSDARGKIALVSLALLLCVVPSALAQDSQRIIHVYVALCDNEHQGIIPVAAKLGNGDDPENNLYWGALYGVKTFFKRSEDWKLISSEKNLSDTILERCVFEHKTGKAFLVADAYRGSEIKKAIADFLDSASGRNKKTLSVKEGSKIIQIQLGEDAQLVAYVGHDGLMDFQLEVYPAGINEYGPDVIILACKSKQFFSEPLRKAKAKPLLWTTGLMAPEAYTLKSAVDAWITGESPQEVRMRAAKAYQHYQKCSSNAAMNLLVTGW